MGTSLYAPFQPTGQTVFPWMATGPRAPVVGGNDPSLLGGLLAAFQKIFAAAEPPFFADTEIAGRVLAQMADPITGVETNTSYWSYMTRRMTLAQSRRNMHKEYDEMEDNFPEISSALDIYGDNVVSTDSFTEDVVSIVTDDEEIGALFLVMKDILKLDKLLWTRARELAGRGEHFDEVVFDLTGFISRLKPLPSAYMERNEDEYGLLPFERAFTEVDDSYKTEVEFGKWQILHYRMLKRPDDIYGTGLLYAIRRLTKKLALAEDALMLTRLTRAHKKLLYKIPTDNMSPDERKKYINDVKREFRKRRVINPRTQKLDLEANPLASEDDIFLGSTKDNPVDVKEIGGDPSVGTLTDIDFWQRKLFSALKVPPAYLGIEKDINAKATLTEQDVQFARTVHRVQMGLQEGIRELFDRAITLYGRNPREVDYTLSFPAISLIDELRNWEVENLKLSAALQFADLFRPEDKWLLTEYLGFSADEASELLANQQPLPEPVAGEGGAGGAPPAPGPGEEGGPEEGEEQEEYEYRRHNEFMALVSRAKKLKVLGQRPERRKTAALQAAERKTLAKEIAATHGAIRKRLKASGRPVATYQ